MRDDDEFLQDEEKINAQRDAEHAQFMKRQKYLDDWREVLSTPAGRRIVWDLLGGMGFQRDLFSSDPLIMAAQCGQHKLSLQLASSIEEAVPGVIFKTQNEIRSAQAGK